jgi:hypothetical protein
MTSNTFLVSETDAKRLGMLASECSCIEPSLK